MKVIFLYSYREQELFLKNNIEKITIKLFLLM